MEMFLSHFVKKTMPGGLVLSVFIFLFLPGGDSEAQESSKEPFAIPSDCTGEKRTDCMQKARHWIDTQQCEEALILLLKIIEHHPDDVQAYQLAGYCSENLGQPQEAVDFYQKAVDMNEKDWRSYYGIGRSKIMLAKQQTSRPELLDQAIQAFEQASRIHPEDEMTRALMCMIFIERGRYQDCVDEAVAFFDKHEVRQPHLLKAAAVSAGQIGETKRLMQWIRKGSRLFPEDYYFNYWGAFLDLAENEIQAAKDKFAFLKEAAQQGLNHYEVEKDLDLEDLQKAIEKTETALNQEMGK